MGKIVQEIRDKELTDDVIIAACTSDVRMYYFTRTCIVIYDSQKGEFFTLTPDDLFKKVEIEKCRTGEKLKVKISTDDDAPIVFPYASIGKVKIIRKIQVSI